MKGGGDPENKEWLGLASVTFTGEKCGTQAFIFKLPQPLVIHRYFSPHSRANDLWHLGSPQRRDFELTEFSLSSTQFQDNLKFLLLELWPTHPSSGASWWVLAPAQVGRRAKSEEKQN